MVFSSRLSFKYGWLVIGLVVLLFSYVTVPVVPYKIGNVFFGGIPALYNINLAQFFFWSATKSLVGEAPQYAHYQLSRVYFIKGEYELALVEAEKEIESYPENWRTHYIIGLTLGYMNREEDAIEAFGKFLEHKPESWAARNDRAWLQFRIGDIDGALETIEPVAGMKNNPWVQNTYGTILMNLDRLDEARQAFVQVNVLMSQMTEESWGRAYPGNDPRMYSAGLRAMQLSVATNLKLLDSKENSVNKLTYPPLHL